MKNYHASVFLSLLDPDASFFTFQTFSEPKHTPIGLLPQVLHGSFQDILPKLNAMNRQGAGIFVSVNATDGKGRKAENIIRIRAIWQDDDVASRERFRYGPPWSLRPHPASFSAIGW